MKKEICSAKVSWKIFILPFIFGGLYFFATFMAFMQGGVTFIPFLIIAILILAPAFIKMACTELILFESSLRGELGLIKKETLDAPLDKINNVYTNRGLIGGILGYGNINISTSSSNFKFKGIENYEFIAQEIMKQVEIYKKQQMEEQARLMAEAIKNANK